MRMGSKIYMNKDVVISQFFSLQFSFFAMFVHGMFTLDSRHLFVDVGLIEPEEVSLGKAHLGNEFD